MNAAANRRDNNNRRNIQKWLNYVTGLADFRHDRIWLRGVPAIIDLRG
jgi:hypothetical protein